MTKDKVWDAGDDSDTWCYPPSIGWTKYKEKFGVEFDEEKLDNFHYLLSVACRELPPLPADARACHRELSLYLQECVERGEQATTKSYSDFFFLEKDGVYRYLGIEEKNFDAFIKAIENTNCYF